MTRVLLVTVGGSPEPILHAVRSHQPDEVVFVCSAPPCPSPSLDQVIGEGLPCRHESPRSGGEEWRPNLVIQLGLTEFRDDLQVLGLPDPDDLADAYLRIRAHCATLRQRFSRLDLLGDYSGGTKSMSAALSLALLEEEAQLTVVAGERSNLIRIDQSLGLTAMRISPLRAARSLRERLPLLLADHRYDRLRDSLADYRRGCGDALDGQAQDAAERLDRCLEALMRWDRFQWREALELAATSPLVDTFPELIDWWQRVVAASQWFEGHEPELAVTGYELVQDLLLNAERRGRRGWSDDAVARLYRALELLAQTYLRLELPGEGPADPSPGLGRLYGWLRERERGGGLGGCADRQWGRLRQLLNQRNGSLLGHGLRPVDQASWQALQQRVSNLVADTLTELGITQGPPPCQLPGPSLTLLTDLQDLAGLES